MKTGKTLALTLGLAAGAVVTLLVTGRNVKKSRPSGSLFNGDRWVKLTSNKYDDSEMYYI